MFCGGKKKDKSNIQQLDNDNTCRIHKAPLDLICIKSTDDIPTQIRCCQGCKQERKTDEFVLMTDLKNKVSMQSTADLVEELHKTVLPFMTQTENLKQQFDDLLHSFNQIVKGAIDQSIVNVLLKEDHPKSIFSAADIHLLVTNHVMNGIKSLTEQQPLNKTDDESVYMFAKLTAHEDDSKQLCRNFSEEPKNVKGRLDAIVKDMREQLNILSKSLQQIQAKHSKVMKIDLNETSLHFIQQSQQYTQQAHGQLLQGLQDIKQLKKIKKQIYDENEEQLQIKSIAQLSKDLIVYSTNRHKVHMIEDEVEVNVLDPEGEVTVISSIVVNHQMQIMMGVEVGTGYQIQLWDSVTMKISKVIPAHKGYIWNIICLPRNQIASCSDDSSIKIFDVGTLKEVRTIQVHQASVNDITLVSQSSLASVSDDGLTILVAFDTGDVIDMHNEEGEVKCITNLDGQRFVTGNNVGDIKIFGQTDKLVLIQTIKVHQSLIRFIRRVSPKIVVTSSWDGTHAFVDCDGGIIKAINGPKKNFSEGLVWVREKNQLWAGSSGQIMIYQ